MAKRLDHKTAVVTGGASGIGKACALRFLEEGASVVLLDSDRKQLDETLEEAKKISGRAAAVYADVAKQADVESAVKAAAGLSGPADILLNAAEIRSSDLLHNVSKEEWEKVFSVNIKGVYLMCRFVLPQMMTAKRGTVINIAAGSGSGNVSGMAAYRASKGAVPSLTRSIAIDYAPYHIRANYICPGNDRTDGCRGAAELAGIANAAVFLASDESGFMTGAMIAADRGCPES